MKRKTSLIIFLIIVLLLIGIFCYVKLKPYSYEVKYTINNYHIEESYNTETSEYTFYITINDVIYPYLINSDYIKSKKLITDIEYYNSADEECILPVSSFIDFYPICSSNEELYSYNLSNIEINSFSYQEIIVLNKEIDNLIISYLDSSNYLVYDYKGFIYINQNTQNYISLFDSDVYNINLVYQLDNYIVVADYNSSYYFNKFYVINLSDGSYKEIEFDYDISFESYFLGSYNNKVYLLDKKEEKEYVINLKKSTIEETDFIVLIDNNLVNTTYKKIINTYKYFDNVKEYNYKLNESVLYSSVADYLIKLSDREIEKIINVIDDTVYYLSDGELYLYNNQYGEVLLMSYFEWNFNNTNVIYISS